MTRRGKGLLAAAAVLLLGSGSAVAQVSDEPVNTIREVFTRLGTCWRPPQRAHPIDITVVVSFNRAGQILGHPRITYESAQASYNDRLLYRVAVMEALQRCTPMPFTEAMAGAAAGRPFAVQFHGRKTSPRGTPQAKERRA